MAILFTITICVVLSYAVWYFQTLFANYRKAQRSGFPILVCPVDTNNVLWMVFSVPLRPILARYLPTIAYNRIKAAIYGWEYLYRYELFAWLGASFILVTPRKNELWTADPEIAHEILTRRNDFIQMDIASGKSGSLIHLLH